MEDTGPVTRVQITTDLQPSPSCGLMHTSPTARRLLLPEGTHHAALVKAVTNSHAAGYGGDNDDSYDGGYRFSVGYAGQGGGGGYSNAGHGGPLADTLDVAPNKVANMTTLTHADIIDTIDIQRRLFHHYELVVILI